MSKKRGNGEGSKRAILYARVSTEEQMKGYSIPDQLRELRAYAAREGYVVVEELAAALSELDEVRETAECELETARARGEALRRLEHDRDALMESYAGMVSETLEDLAPEERHRIYKLLRLGVRYRPDWPLEITGVFAQVAEEAEIGSSHRKPTSLSV